MCGLGWTVSLFALVLLKPNYAFPVSLKMPVTFPLLRTVTCHTDWLVLLYEI